MLIYIYILYDITIDGALEAVDGGVEVRGVGLVLLFIY